MRDWITKTWSQVWGLISDHPVISATVGIVVVACIVADEIDHAMRTGRL